MGYWKRIVTVGIAGAGALLLGGCMLTAGKFDSQLTLMKDGSFAFTYDGEIQMLALTEMAQMGRNADETFTPDDCYDDESFEERECTAEELSEQKARWDEGASERAAKKARDVETAKALLGGIDPSSPEAAREIVERLERQKGWNKVTYLGNGLFDVEYAINGQLSHDFAFPVMERLPMGNAFVALVLRDGGQVRIDAPGFVVQDTKDPMRAMMVGMAGLANMESQQDAEDAAASTQPRIILPEGRFTIVTNGTVLANNTDEGPGADPRGKQLVWQINPRSEQPPMALIDLSQ